jgi:predicted membrane protein
MAYDTLVDEPVAAEVEARPRSSADARLLGGLLLVLGTGWLVREIGLVDLAWDTLLSIVLITLGLGLVATARTGRRAGFIALGIVLTVILASGSAFKVKDLDLGDRPMRPTILPDDGMFNRGFGDLTLDLRSLELTGGRTITVNSGFGDVTVIVPEGTTVDGTVNIGGGSLTVFGDEEAEGIGIDQSFGRRGDEGAPRISMEIHVGFGDVEIAEAPDDGGSPEGGAR